MLAVTNEALSRRDDEQAPQHVCASCIAAVGNRASATDASVPQTMRQRKLAPNPAMTHDLIAKFDVMN